MFKGKYFDHAEDFSNHLARVEVEGKWGFINEKGRICDQSPLSKTVWILCHLISRQQMFKQIHL
jgi:hypothetical protein